MFYQIDPDQLCSFYDNVNGNLTILFKSEKLADKIANTDIFDLRTNGLSVYRDCVITKSNKRKIYIKYRVLNHISIEERRKDKIEKLLKEL